MHLTIDELIAEGQLNAHTPLEKDLLTGLELARNQIVPACNTLADLAQAILSAPTQPERNTAMDALAGFLK